MTPYQRKQEQHEQQKQQQRQEAHRRTLNDPDGRMVLRALLDYCGLFRSSLDLGMEQLPILEGRRQIALSIQALCLAVDPAAYQRLLSELIGNGYD